MDAGGGEAQDDVALFDQLRADHLGAVDDAHAKAREVVVVFGHDTGVLGDLAAHERAVGLLAALCDAADDLGHLLGLELADGDVVEEEQGLGAAGEDVVDAHGHEVDAAAVVAVDHLGQLELGAHAVCARDHDRVFHILEGGCAEQAAKAADVSDDLGAVGALHGSADCLDGAGALIDVNAGVLVGDLLVGHVCSSRCNGRNTPRSVV